MTVSTEKGRRVRLQERVLNGVSVEKIDKDAGVIRDVRLLGVDSRNNRVYEPAAKQRARELYEGCPVRIDHKPEANVRAVIDDIGWIENAREVEDGVIGDFHVLKSHPYCELIFEKALRSPEKFGFSHDADGYVEVGDDGVEHVVDLFMVESLDLVTKPATTKSLFEEVRIMPRVEKKKIRTAIMRAPKGTPGKSKLMEMIDNDATNGEFEVASDATPAVELEAALKATLMTILDNAELDAEAKIDLIKELLAGPGEEVSEEEDSKDGESKEEDDKESVEESESDPDLKDVPESVRKRVSAQDKLIAKQAEALKKMQESQDRAAERERKRNEEDSVRRLFESAGVVNVSGEDVEAAMQLSGGHRARFIESVRQAQAAEQFAGPRSSAGSRPATVYPSGDGEFLKNL